MPVGDEMHAVVAVFVVVVAPVEVALVARLLRSFSVSLSLSLFGALVHRNSQECTVRNDW